MSETIKWNSEPPTELGYYWAKNRRTLFVDMAYVRWSDRIESRGGKRLVADFCGGDTITALSAWLWSDRLEVPS